MTQNSVIQLNRIHKSYYVGMPNELEILHGMALIWTLKPVNLLPLLASQALGNRL